ncbi:MAG: hypothetical protein V4550_10080 [Gemmatimonadota bacterium]
MAITLTLAACAPPPSALELSGFTPAEQFGERVRVIQFDPGVTATIVAPSQLDGRQRVDLILYALPNGNSTAETMGRLLADGVGWRYDIQHIGAQTRALRARGLSQAIIVYLEADRKSWPEWRSRHGYESANPRIVSIVDQLRAEIGNPERLAVTLTGHSGGGSFAWGFIDGQQSLPDWLERIAFLDSNYSYEARHGRAIMEWLRRAPEHTLVSLAYDDREIMLDGKKVVSDSGGTWRASHRMLADLQASYALTADSLGEFLRYRDTQIEILLHPNPANRILHTEMIGEMNGFMHALLFRRPGYRAEDSVLRTRRAYPEWISSD